MIIKLYKFTGEDLELNKALQNERDFDIVEKSGDFDPHNDRVMITENLKNIKGRYNYAMIPSLGIYYFIRSTAAVNNRITSLFLEYDPLMTFREQLLETEAIIDRSQFLGITNQYIADGQLPLEQGTEINRYVVETPPLDGCVVVCNVLNPIVAD